MRALEMEPDLGHVRMAVLERALPPPSLSWRLRDMEAIRLMSTEVVYELAEDPTPLTIFARKFPHRFAHEVLVLPNVALVEVRNTHPGQPVVDPHVDMGLPIAASDAEIKLCVQRAIQKKQDRFEYLDGLGMVNEKGSLCLSYSEKLLLNHLLLSRESVILKENLARALWGVAVDDALSTSRAIDTLVYRLRRKLTGVQDMDIETVRSRGFRLVGKEGCAAQYLRNVFQFQDLDSQHHTA